MKVFTPELYARLQSADTDEMDAADAQWERAEVKYAARLKSIRSKLPNGALYLIDELRLHDAEVLWMGETSLTLFILLRLNSPSKATLALAYTMQRPVRIEQGVIPTDMRSSNMQWMYDEVDVGHDPQCFKHSIQFSNGCHVEIEALRFNVTTLDTLYAVDQVKLPA